MTDRDEIIQHYRDKVRNPLTAVRAFCVECMGGYVSEVKACSNGLCPLHPFRMGRNPLHGSAGKTPESAIKAKNLKEKEQDHE
jgi:hypothetical protein